MSKAFETVDVEGIITIEGYFMKTSKTVNSIHQEYKNHMEKMNIYGYFPLKRIKLTSETTLVLYYRLNWSKIRELKV